MCELIFILDTLQISSSELHHIMLQTKEKLESRLPVNFHGREIRTSLNVLIVAIRKSLLLSSRSL